MMLSAKASHNKVKKSKFVMQHPEFKLFLNRYKQNFVLRRLNNVEYKLLLNIS